MTSSRWRTGIISGGGIGLLGVELDFWGTSEMPDLDYGLLGDYYGLLGDLNTDFWGENRLKRERIKPLTNYGLLGLFIMDFGGYYGFLGVTLWTSGVGIGFLE